MHGHLAEINNWQKGVPGSAALQRLPLPNQIKLGYADSEQPHYPDSDVFRSSGVLAFCSRHVHITVLPQSQLGPEAK